jgi:hypothetical protein
MLSRQFSAKVTGFAHAVIDGYSWADEPTTTFAPPYQAPEAVDSYEVHRPCDVFPFAFLLWEIVRCERAVRAPSWIALEAHIRKGGRPSTTGLPPDLTSVIEACWHPNPDVRATFGQIFEKFQALNYALLPKVDRAAIQEYVTPILAWERDHPPRPLGG